MRARTLLTAATFVLGFAVFGIAPAAADLSSAARATSVLDEEGKPLGLNGYETAGDAIRAGDMAAYLEALAEDTDNEVAPSNMRALVLSIDALAAEDFDEARAVIAKIREDDEDSQLLAYINAWVYAFEGDAANAISEHRAAASGLPGNTGDLSLAAMLEGLGRDEEAVLVYASLTPKDITAPEHDFDSRGIYFDQIRTVIARQAIVLRRLGRIEDAKDVYRKLAKAEPERAVSYAAAIEMLESGEGLDDEIMTPRTAFARTITDVSSALSLQRLFRLSQAGRPINTFDETRSMLDQAALLLAPEDEDLRSLVVGTLHRQAYYDGAAHVALSAPEQTPHLSISAAFAYMLQLRKEDSAKALDAALTLEIEDETDKFNILLRAARIYAFLDKTDTALSLSNEAMALARNDAERAVANAAMADVLQHFNRYSDALTFAQKAAEIDNTHDRRVYVTSILGELGQNEEALKTLRRAHLNRPNDPYALNTLGYYLISHTEEYAEGYKLLARAEKLAPRNPYILDSVGWARYLLGDLVGARVLVEQSKARLAPERHWEIEDHLGDIYWHQGRKEDARKAWQTAIDAYPPYRVRDEILAKLDTGISGPPPEKQPIPSVSLEDDGRINERDI